MWLVCHPSVGKNFNCVCLYSELSSSYVFTFSLPCLNFVIAVTIAGIFKTEARFDNGSFASGGNNYSSRVRWNRRSCLC